MTTNSAGDGRSTPLCARQPRAIDPREIAETLHDGVMQLISALRMKLRSIELDADGLSIDARNSLRDMDALSERALIELADLVRSLASHGSEGPMGFDTRFVNARGLAIRLNEFVRAFQAETGLNCFIDLKKEHLAFPPHVGEVVIRSVGELLNNVDKHACATRVEIRSSVRDDGYVVISVADNGHGCPELAGRRTASSATKGFGLFSIQSRLADFGAQLELDGRRGFRATLALPAGLLIE